MSDDTHTHNPGRETQDDKTNSASSPEGLMAGAFDVSRVAAPMVGCSDLAFRLLCRRHGATLCYTEMFYADRFVESAEYRNEVFFSQLSPEDRPLAVQFAANDAATLVAAAQLVAPYCDMVDLNLGCPQKRAQEGSYGSYLLDRADWPLVFGMVRALAKAVPLASCKIRLLPSLQQTLRFCRGLEAAGCGLLAVHGRQRGSPTRRRSGPADLRAIKAIKRALHIPVLTNGNVRCAGDIAVALERTRADGAMVGEALLRDPAVLHPAAPDLPTVRARRELLREYLALAATHAPPDVAYVRAHLTWQMGRVGSGARLRFKHLPFLSGPTARDELALASSVTECLAWCERSWAANDALKEVGAQVLLDGCSASDSEPAGSEQGSQLATGSGCRTQEREALWQDEEANPWALPPTGRVMALWHQGSVRFVTIPYSADEK